ncbi:hypothetical protein HOP50_04g27820 [Chloropicon primus]|uniref:Glutaredoxin domain-containing protein n=2 Tax=Chloropicon primus TaxID=1764295 RepID=A0A5B8MKN8_9CHLO|nr:hypothetical protein A3770_04p27830 [Chloropicon primus]UPQ99474.1 hypothetical protein HOP50_04g27820 [Chloropicon primus]|eukprot:QDZ20265.1 hypothetical protein A3770_04p27830 [Chloropicon primus]
MALHCTALLCIGLDTRQEEGTQRKVARPEHQQGIVLAEGEGQSHGRQKEKEGMVGRGGGVSTAKAGRARTMSKGEYGNRWWRVGGRSHVLTVTRTAGGGDGVPESSRAARYTLVLYGKPECQSCDDMKRKVSALIDRAKFVPGPLSEATLVERDINDDLKWVWKYGGSIPELGCVVDGDEEGEVLLPRVSHRETTDSIGRHLEKVLGNLTSE